MADDSGGLLSDIAETIGDVAGAAAGELKKFGQTAASQISGHAAGTGQPTKPDIAKVKSAEIAKMAKADNKFSQVESAKIKAKINQIYQEYAARRAREEKQQKMVVEQQSEQKKAIEEDQKRQEMDINPAITKTRAEIKNYGAE